MFYQEKIINGVLMCRSMPNGEWRLCEKPYAQAVNTLMKLSEKDRASAISLFCYFCGEAESNGQCCSNN